MPGEGDRLGLGVVTDHLWQQMMLIWADGVG